MAEKSLEETTDNERKEIEGAVNLYEYEVRGRANEGIIHNCWTGREIRYRIQ